MTKKDGIEFAHAGDIPVAAEIGRKFLLALEKRPGEWARVPEGIALQTMRSCATFSVWFGVKVETRVVEEVQYARWVEQE